MTGSAYSSRPSSDADIYPKSRGWFEPDGLDESTVEAHLSGCRSPTDTPERRRLNRQVRKGTIIRPYPFADQYMESNEWVALDPISRHVLCAQACAKSHPDWIFCFTTAAAIWDLHPPFSKLDTLHVVVPHGGHRENTSFVTFHRLSEIKPVVHRGVLVTSLDRTSIDCMRTLPFADGLAVADACVRQADANNLCLASYLDQNVNVKLHGLYRARVVALLADAKSESGGESIARANMIRAGFALPALQQEMTNPLDGKHFRVDFVWPIASSAAALDEFSNASAPQPGAHIGNRAHPSACISSVGKSQEMPRDKPIKPNSDTLIKPIFGELDGKQKYIDKNMAPEGPIDTLLAERRRESVLTLASSAIVRFSYQEANSLAQLANKLDTFGVPHACEPLQFTRSGRHNLTEVERYLKANSATNASVGERLSLLDEMKSHLLSKQTQA